MSENESPADTLRRAASLIRYRAEVATPGPWENPVRYAVTYGYHGNEDERPTTWIASTDIGGGEPGDIGDEQAGANAAWIALMNPALGAALAGWLEAEAHEVGIVGTSEARTFHALRVARFCLGDPS